MNRLLEMMKEILRALHLPEMAKVILRALHLLEMVEKILRALHLPEMVEEILRALHLPEMVEEILRALHLPEMVKVMALMGKTAIAPEMRAATKRRATEVKKVMVVQGRNARRAKIVFL